MVVGGACRLWTPGTPTFTPATLHPLTLGVSIPESQPFRVFAGINFITQQHPDTIVPEVLLH
jgi:hypothetical protein